MAYSYALSDERVLREFGCTRAELEDRSVEKRDEAYFRRCITKDRLWQGGVLAYEMPLQKNRVDIAEFSTEYLQPGIAYEIKTKHDTLNRLESQIQTYKRFFEKVYVVIDYDDEKKKKVIQEQFPDVGLIQLNEYGVPVYISESEIDPGQLDYDAIYNQLYAWQLKIMDPTYIQYRESQEKFRKRAFDNDSQIHYFWKEISKMNYLIKNKFIRDNWHELFGIDLLSAFKFFDYGLLKLRYGDLSGLKKPYLCG